MQRVLVAVTIVVALLMPAIVSAQSRTLQNVTITVVGEWPCSSGVLVYKPSTRFWYCQENYSLPSASRARWLAEHEHGRHHAR
jgi:hypothetical protein